VRARLGVLALGAALAFSGSSLAAPATTGPGQHVTILVRLTDRGILVWYQASMARGAIATFAAVNDGKRPHDFAVFGKRTKVLKPGGRGQFTVSLLTRGNFPYESTLDKRNKAFHGLFTVY
jgi:hypothetical protein